MMEVWLSILIAGVLTAVSILITGYQITKSTEKIVKEISREMSEHIGKAIEAIHADIKHTQEKIERRMEEK